MAPFAFYYHRLNLGCVHYAALAGLLATVVAGTYLWVGHAHPEARPHLLALMRDVAPTAILMGALAVVVAAVLHRLFSRLS